MTTPTDYKAILRRPEGINRLMAEGVPLCRIEEMLDEMEYEAARHVSSIPGKSGWFGRLSHGWSAGS
jgi:hypothetical protein